MAYTSHEKLPKLQWLLQAINMPVVLCPFHVIRMIHCSLSGCTCFRFGTQRSLTFCISVFVAGGEKAAAERDFLCAFACMVVCLLGQGRYLSMLLCCLGYDLCHCQPMFHQQIHNALSGDLFLCTLGICVIAHSSVVQFLRFQIQILYSPSFTRKASQKAVSIQTSKQQCWHTSTSIVRGILPSAPTIQHTHPPTCIYK